MKRSLDTIGSQSSGLIENTLKTGLRLAGAVPTFLLETLTPKAISGQIERNREKWQAWSGAAVVGGFALAA